ncbi:RnfABCDGE type electron transport complex subunit D [Pseudothermotoga sp. U03pept]|uniref:RnfABCDGE type electron transport complex subunit D n=1 Tax=Pseudothermotoga sp. U03pept TaxID=3447012 RepID=UPI003F01BA6A
MAFFQKQPLMRRVLYSLLPIYLFALSLYGLRLLWLSLFVFTTGILTEYVMERQKGKAVTEAVLVTCSLLTLSLPPLTPWWVAIIASFFAVFFAKEVYGGFGRNIFNPAIVGRLFVYIAFPIAMTTNWLLPRTDSVTGATPLDLLRAGSTVDLKDLFFGIRPGAMGESSVLLIVAAAVYLVLTKTASFRIILSTFTSAAVLSFLLEQFANAPSTVAMLFSGSLLFVTVFMATDPVSAPKKASSQWLYGVIIGVCTVLIRMYSLFSEGTSFGVLMGNTFASLLDEVLSKKKVKA